MFVDLPYETQHAIGPFLSSHDLTTCVLVSREWRDIFTPSLWSHIGASPTWSMHQQAWQDTFDAGIAQGCLTRYGHFIRSINLTLNLLRLKDFLTHCPAIFPRLTSASLKCIAQDDETVADFLGRCSPTKGWKSLSLDGTGASLYFGEASAKALLKHAATLESFSLVPGFRFPSKSIHELLCSASGLKKLDLIGHIPRPDIAWETDEEPTSEFVAAGTRRESLTLQRRVYTELARLTRLKELWLGTPLWRSRSPRGSLCEIVSSSEENWIYDGLAMTLEGGMDLLKELKELKVVGLKDMAVDGLFEEAEQK
ncbi:hypothetical protein BGW39_009750 [Mortierella sp. 14UC]|nr:hypothetical protein BGW39_009750 [Mortierella sp. 14UC]